MNRISFMLFLPIVALGGCASSPATAPDPQEPPLPPPVTCVDVPNGRQVTVTCRSFDPAQRQEVWNQALDHAALAAIATGSSHVQFLSVEWRPEFASNATTIECHPRIGSWKCNGAQDAAPISWLAIGQFAMLSPQEAAAREGDPLIPAERRPVDARQRIIRRRGAPGVQPTAPSADMRRP